METHPLPCPPPELQLELCLKTLSSSFDSGGFLTQVESDESWPYSLLVAGCSRNWKCYIVNIIFDTTLFSMYLQLSTSLLSVVTFRWNCLICLVGGVSDTRGKVVVHYMIRHTNIYSITQFLLAERHYYVHVKRHELITSKCRLKLDKFLVTI